MGGQRDFVQKVQQSGWTGAIDVELDELRSEYPPLVTSGYWNWSQGSVAKTSILLVPSSKVLHLQNILINNDSDEANRCLFFDGPGTSVEVGRVQVNRSTTAVIGGLKGWIFQSAVHASLVTSLTQIRVGGIIRDS